MTIFGLVFIGAFLGTAGVLVTVLIHALRRRPKQAVRVLVVYGVFLAVYLCVLLGVSLASSQRILDRDQDRCFDDWCVAVVSTDTTPVLGQGEHAVKANGVFYVVTLRLSNGGRGRAQRASSAAVHLRDGQGKSYDVSPRGQAAYEAELGPAAPLTATLIPGQPITTVRVFDAPMGAQMLGLTIEHPVGLSPGFFVIGDESSLLHKPTLIRLR